MWNGSELNSGLWDWFTGRDNHIWFCVMVYLNNVSYSHSAVGYFYTALSPGTPLLSYSKQTQLS